MAMNISGPPWVVSIPGDVEDMQVSGPPWVVSITPREAASPLGITYYPGWADASSWLSVNPARYPVRGQYDEDLQSVCDGQIAEMIDAGIEFVNLCWYWDSNTNLPHAEHWANNWRASANSAKPSLAIFWDNTYTISTPASWSALLDYLASVHFNRSDILRISGRPVFTIYVLNAFKSQVGGGTDEGCAAALGAARSMYGIYFVAATSALEGGEWPMLGEGPGSAAAMGFDAVTAYNLVAGVDWSQLLATYASFYAAALAGPLKVILPMTAGWDNSGEPGGVSIANPNQAQFEAGLAQAKAARESAPDKVVGYSMCAWNEYVEGSVVEPALLYGLQSRINSLRAVMRPEL